jgi:hypothetical protein
MSIRFAFGTHDEVNDTEPRIAAAAGTVARPAAVSTILIASCMVFLRFYGTMNDRSALLANVGFIECCF